MDWILSLICLMFGLLVVAGGFAGLIWVLPKLRTYRAVHPQRARRTMEQVAGKMPWVRMGPGPEPLLLFEQKGYPGRVEYRGGRRPATDVTLDLGGAVDGWLQVAPESVAHGMLKRFGATDIHIGDARFDDDHEVYASSREFAVEILDEDHRSLLRSLGVRGNFVFRVSPKAFLLRMEQFIYDPEVLEGFVMSAVSLFRGLGLPERGHFEVTEVKETVTAEAQCEICGTPLSRGTVVRCAKCRTPHHKDCWEFNGVCSTFACGSREYG